MQEHVRFATLKDSSRILEIYSPYILNTTISFEYTTPSLAEFTDRIAKLSNKYPYLVYERNEKILGFAYGSPIRNAALIFTTSTFRFIWLLKHSLMV